MTSYPSLTLRVDHSAPGAARLSFEHGDEEAARARRAARRASWPGRVVSLDDEGGEDLSASTTPEQRLGMMWRLALDAWASMGRELPAYDRANAPGRVLRRDD